MVAATAVMVVVVTFLTINCNGAGGCGEDCGVVH